VSDSARFGASPIVLGSRGMRVSPDLPPSPDAEALGLLVAIGWSAGAGGLGALVGYIRLVVTGALARTAEANRGPRRLLLEVVGGAATSAFVAPLLVDLVSDLDSDSEAALRFLAFGIGLAWSQIVGNLARRVRAIVEAALGGKGSA